MIDFTIALVFITFQACANCGGETTPINEQGRQSQLTGLSEVVKTLEQEVNTLAKDNHRQAWVSSAIDRDQQVAVVDLADSMVDNVLLTRAYLALAVAELKVVQVIEKIGSDIAQLEQYLRHIEAISLAIDDRILESADLRIYRVLRAGVNQALRHELERLAAGKGSVSQRLECSVAPSIPLGGVDCITRCQSTRFTQPPPQSAGIACANQKFRQPAIVFERPCRLFNRRP